MVALVQTGPDSANRPSLALAPYLLSPRTWPTPARPKINQASNAGKIKTHRKVFYYFPFLSIKKTLLLLMGPRFIVLLREPFTLHGPCFPPPFGTPRTAAFHPTPTMGVEKMRWLSGSVPFAAWVGVNESTALVHHAAALTTRLRTHIDRSNCTHVLLSRRQPRLDRSIPDYQISGPSSRGPGLDRDSIASSTLFSLGGPQTN